MVSVVVVCYYKTLIMASLLALALGAKAYKLTRPRVSRGNVVQIKGGR